MSTCSAFAQTLRRYTSLNHLAQAARAVLQNSSQISQMLTDLNRVDFANVQVRLTSVFLYYYRDLYLSRIYLLGAKSQVGNGNKLSWGVRGQATPPPPPPLKCFEMNNYALRYNLVHFETQ